MYCMYYHPEEGNNNSLTNNGVKLVKTDVGRNGSECFAES